MSTLIPKFTYCTTLGGTPIQNPGNAPAAGVRIGAKDGPSLGPYVITDNGVPVSTGKTYDFYGVFDDQILNLAPGPHNLELRENPSLPATDVWRLTVASTGGPLGPIALSPVVTGLTISADGTKVYVTGAGMVQVIDTATSTLTKLIPIKEQTVSWEIALNQDATRAFTCSGNNALLVIDTASSTVLRSIPAAGHPIGVVLSKDGYRAYVSTWQTNTVVVVDLLNLVPIKVIPVGPYPRGIDISPDGRWVYVANFGNGPGWSVSVIDTLTLSVVRTVPMPVAAYGVAVSPDGNSIYVCGGNNNGEGFVVQFSTQTWTQVRAIRVIGGPRGIVLNHAGTQAYCCDSATNTVSVIDTASGQVVATIPVGQGPLEIAISADDSRAFVTCVYDNTVWVISLLPGPSGFSVFTAQQLAAASVSAASRPPIPGDAY